MPLRPPAAPRARTRGRPAARRCPRCGAPRRRARGPPPRRGARRRRRAVRVRPPEIAGQLGVERVLLEDGDALRAPLALRPQLQRLAPEARGVAVCVDRDASRDRGQQRLERTRVVARGEPVRRDLRGIVIAGAERLGQAPVKRAPPQPRDVVVDRLARERVAEPRAARLGLDQAPGASSSPSPARPPTSATTSRSTTGPATAATSAADRAASEREVMWTRTASRTVCGSGTSTSRSRSMPSAAVAQPVARRAAQRSAPRRRTGRRRAVMQRAHEPRDGAAPRICSTSAAVSAGVSGATPARRAPLAAQIV